MKDSITKTDLHAAFIETETRGACAIIRLNRPEVRNAINDQMRQELIAAF